MRYSNKIYVERIKELAAELVGYIMELHVTREMILTKCYCQWTITTPLCRISWLIAELTEDYKNRYNNISWDAIISVGFSMINDYESVVWNDVADVIFNHIMALAKLEITD